MSNEYLFQCAICGVSEGDASNLTTQSSLQMNAAIGCGHALYVFSYYIYIISFFI